MAAEGTLSGCTRGTAGDIAKLVVVADVKAVAPPEPGIIGRAPAERDADLDRGPNKGVAPAAETTGTRWGAVVINSLAESGSSASSAVEGVGCNTGRDSVNADVVEGWTRVAVRAEEAAAEEEADNEAEVGGLGDFALAEIAKRSQEASSNSSERSASASSIRVRVAALEREDLGVLVPVDLAVLDGDRSSPPPTCTRPLSGNLLTRGVDAAAMECSLELPSESKDDAEVVVWLAEAREEGRLALLELFTPVAGRTGVSESESESITEFQSKSAAADETAREFGANSGARVVPFVGLGSEVATRGDARTGGRELGSAGFTTLDAGDSMENWECRQ